MNTSTWAKLEPDALDQIVAKTNTILRKMFQQASHPEDTGCVSITKARPGAGVAMGLPRPRQLVYDSGMQFCKTLDGGP